MTNKITPHQEKQEISLKEKTAKGLFWSFFDRFGQQVIAFVFNLIMANLLLPSDFGLISVLAVFIAISTTLIDSGFGNALIREKEEPDNTVYSTIFLFNFFISVSIYLVLYISSPFIASYFDKPILLTLSRIACIPIIINALGLVQQVKLIRQVDFKTITRINLTSTIVSGCIAIVSAYKGLGVYAIVVQNISNSILKIILLWAKTKWIPQIHFSKKVLSRFFSYSSKIAIVGIINVIFDNLYILFIGKYHNMTKLGYYSYAKKIHDVPSFAISLAVQDVTFPVLSKLVSEEERLVRAFRKSIKMASFLLFPVLWGLGTISESFFAVFLKAEWQPCVILLQILCITSPFTALCVTNDNLILAKGQSPLFLIITIIKKTLLIICLIATLTQGLTAMVVGLSICNFLFYIINTIATYKTIRFSVFHQFKDILPYMAMSIVMCATVYSLSLFITNHYLLCPLQIIVGALVYWLLCKHLGSKIFHEVIDELKKKLL